MAAPSTTNEFLELVRKSGILDDKRFDAYLQKMEASSSLPDEPGKLAGVLVRDGVLTHFQAEQFLLGKWRRFNIGKYKVLERLGSGGMGSVYLCEHKFMRRRAAVKVLPAQKAEDPSALERFYREARAVAALDHPNIVRAYDIDQDDKLHFLVMEYVDGTSLQEIIKKNGPMNIQRVAHYIRQAAIGLDHAHKIAGLVHRDIKPGNVLVDRNGVVKVLDMGLARFFHDEDDVLTKKYDENVLGTADYLAPEQALDSHGVDIRADIYSLGATCYFCLTASTPFTDGTVAQKLIWHQTRQPKPIRSVRADVPEELVAVISKMMAKDPAQRYQTPAEVVDALAPFTVEQIPLPPEEEMPRLSPAAMGLSNFSETAVAAPVGATLAVPTPAAATPAAPKTPPPAPPSPAPKPRTPAPAKAAPARAPVAPPVRPPTTAPAAVPVKAPVAAAVKAAPRAPVATSALVQPAPKATTTMPTPQPATTPQPVAAPAANNGILLPTPQMLAPPPEEDSGSSWDQLTSQDEEASFRLSSARGSPSRSNLHSFPTVPRRRVWWAIGLALLLLAAAAVGWLKFLSKETDNRAKTSESHGPVVIPVSKTAEAANAPRTIREALGQARVGDVIKVMDETIEEQLLLNDGRLGKGVTIESGLPDNKAVTWNFPAHLKEGDPLLEIIGVEGLQLKGFTLDGQKRSRNLVRLIGKCPGSKLENLTLQGFTGSGLWVVNCGGDKQKPVILTDIRTLSTVKDPPEASIFLSVNTKFVDNPLNQNLVISDGSFEGPYRAAIQIQGTAFDLDIRRNRFFDCDAGVLYKSPKPYPPLKATVTNNTFCNIRQAALLLEGMPLVERNPVDNRMVVQNNLFVNTARIVLVDENLRDGRWGNEPPPPRLTGPFHFIWSSETTPQAAPVGPCLFRKTFDINDPVTKANLDIGCDDEFKVWINGALAGSGKMDYKRVHALDVTNLLRQGKNCLAVQGLNAQGPAGLLVRLTYGKEGAEKTLVSDASWKFSKKAPAGWTAVDFDDSKWAPAKAFAVYGQGGNPDWDKWIWDGPNQDRLAGLVKQFFPNWGGNIRDQATAEGTVAFDGSKVLEFPALPIDPTKDDFLHYPKTSPLFTAGTNQSPVGVPP